MNFDESLRYLLSLGHETLAIKLGLNNIELLLSALRQPQQTFSKVQIAGTNGKGSTAAMLDAATRAAGIRTGLYTSPHLVNITERIRVNGRQILEDDFASLTTQVRNQCTALVEAGALAALPTFFEQVTAISLLAFSEASVDLAILETGLGGRLDATSAANAETVGITSIALDHQEYLGHTLPEIAAEKAAIIRPGVAAIIAPQPAEVMDAILKRCSECDVRPRVADFETEVTGQDEKGRLHVSFKTERDYYEGVRLNLPGRHQVTNASVAIGLAETLGESGFHISREDVVAGLETAEHPGRLEWIDGDPALLFDGAHNVAGARALRAYLEEIVTGPLTLVFGAMRDKDLGEMATILFPLAQHLILTEMDNPRSATREMLAQLVPDHIGSGRVTSTNSAGQALEVANACTPPDGVICVTGSLYLIGEMQTTLQREQQETHAN
jgi:dihydrofolate synthase / folylpolyglutamate synthase